MTRPIHQYASVAVGGRAPRIHEVLTAQAENLAREIVAEVGATMGPTLARWGLPTTQPPTLEVQPTEDDELGSVAIVLSGPTTPTGLPALTGRLVVVPDGPQTTRIAFLSSRLPQGGIGMARLDSLHGHRVVHVTIQRLLHEFARHVSDPDSPAGGVATGVDSRMMHVHDLRTHPGDPHELLARLHDDPLARALHMTRAALAGAEQALHTGAFRARPTPHVHVRPGRADELGALQIRWDSDEEATGWPQLDLAILVAAHRDGAQLAVLSPHPAGYDVSRNRLDKAARDQILRGIGADIATAIVTEAASASATVPANA